MQNSVNHSTAASSKVAPDLLRRIPAIPSLRRNDHSRKGAMKHLLAALAARKIPLDTNETELKLLLAQAQRFRGDNKGVESWEDTLEKILVELRTTDYATAFLKPVKKSEAWDYDRVILHPMDLQTMGRKVKSKAYHSKKAFAEDLNLIWENCLTYNSDPNHPLRRAAQYMRKKADQILRRIPDRHERFAPSMIDRFKYSPSPSPFLSPALPNKPRLLNGNSVVGTGNNDAKPLLKQNGLPTGASPRTPLNGNATVAGAAVEGLGLGLVAKNDAIALVPAEPQTTIHAGVMDVPFEDRPALERTADGMAAFVGFDAAMEEFLESWDPNGGMMKIAGSSSDMGGVGGAGFGMELSDGRPRSSSMMLAGGLPILDVNTRLRQLADEDDELAVWKMVMEDHPAETLTPQRRDSAPPEVEPTDSSESGSGADAAKKRKRGEDLFVPRKRQRLEKIPAPERNPLENWWFAMGSTALLANAVPPSVSSPPMPNPRHARMHASRQLQLQQNQPIDQRTPSQNVFKQGKGARRKKQTQAAGRSTSLFQIMSENVRTRKRARDIAIKIADQIEDEKQGVDPEDLVPLVPVDAATSNQPRKPWARRAALTARRRMEDWEDDIGPSEAQDCMESTAMLVLEHANFDSSSAAALQVLGDIGGRCIQNLGRTLKVLHETHQGKMTAEEMVLHALFSNSIGSMYELEAYIKSDIIKHGASLSNMLHTLEEVATKREEPVDEDAIFKDENEVMTGLGDLGEDIYGFRELGLDTEFGLKSLVVPKRLLRPKAKTASNDEGAAAEVDKYPPPPAFAPLETRRIDDQINLLRPYYHHRVAALIPPPPTMPPPQPVPPRIATPPVVITKSPTPEPVVSEAPASEPPPVVPAAPVFDPYNPSALSIVVPKIPVAPSAPIKAEPTPPKGMTELVPMASPLQPTAAHIHPNLLSINTSLYPDMRPYIPIMVEVPNALEDDTPDPSRVRVGPLGQIMMPSAATVAKQKRQKAAQAKAAAAAAAAISANVAPVTPTSAAIQSPGSATKPKKSTPKKPKKLEAPPVAPVTG